MLSQQGVGPRHVHLQEVGLRRRPRLRRRRRRRQLGRSQLQHPPRRVRGRSVPVQERKMHQQGQFFYLKPAQMKLRHLAERH